MPADAPVPSAFAPLKQRAFLVLWTATILSNVGTWMMSTASAWLMSSLSPSPIMIAAVQAASAAPVFLFALLAGALSDLFDKRRLLLVCQTIAAVGAAAFATLVALDLVTAPLLLGFTFFMATSAAFVAPAWQAIVPRLVARPLLPQAIALNSMGINVARAIGPALAGLLIVTVGIAAPFVFDTLSFLFIIAALLWWQVPPTPPVHVAREHVASAMIGGLRYAANSAEVTAVLVRAAGFFLFASAPMSMLPLVARDGLKGDASAFGLLMAAIGAGAVAGALLLPRFKDGAPARKLLVGTLLTSAAGVGLAFASSLTLALPAAALFGLGWIAVLATLNAGVQLSLPDWVRARGIALFTMVFSGAMMVGSIVWGAIAQATDLRLALFGAATAALAMPLLLARFQLGEGSSDLAPSAHWPEPVVADDVEDDRGPVMVTIDYRIDPAHIDAMMAALHRLEPARRRGGAIQWSVYQDVAVPERIVELFVEQSWAAHLRHHDRVSGADRALQDAVVALHCGLEPPRVTHWLAPVAGIAGTSAPPDGQLG